jgi:hypothetical protein
MASLMAEQINKLEAQLQAETRRLIHNDSLTIRAWCIHNSKGQKPAAIHLENYDDLPAGSLRLIDKLSLARSEEEEAHLQKSLEFHDNLRMFINDMSNGESEIRQTISELKNSLFTDLDDFGQLFGTNTLQEFLSDMDSTIRSSQASAEISQLRSDLVNLQGNLREFFDLKAKHASIVEKIKSMSHPDPLALLTLIQQNLNELLQLRQQLESLASLKRITQIKNSLELLKNNLETQLETFGQNTQFVIQDFVEVKAVAWVERFENIDTLLKRYDALQAVFAELSKSFSFISTINKKVADPDTLIPEEIRDVSLSKAKPTKIPISSTNRQEKDIYNFNVQVLRKGSEVHRNNYSFQIRTYGWYDTWLGSLVFVKGNWLKSFQPATAASWVLHYRNRPGDDGSAGSGILGNFVNLGFGLSSVVFSTLFNQRQY